MRQSLESTRPNAPASADRAPHTDTAPAAALVAVQDACAEVLDICAHLARIGCVVLGAHAIDGRSRIVVATPPAGAKLTASPRLRNRYRAVMATEIRGVQVEWCVRRGVAQ
jgi:hypothetical protein